MIYIQGKDGLTQISSQITKEKIIAALGFTPADNATFYEDEGGALIIADEKGYVIARIDADGLNTTQVVADAISLNGEDLSTKLQNLENKVPEVDLTNYYTKDEVNGKLDNIDIPNLDKYALSADVEANKIIVDNHMDDAKIHVTEEEKAFWSEKSDFSGEYADLSGAPKLVAEEEDSRFVISDGAGNVIMEVDNNGLNVADLYVNGSNISHNSHLSGLKVSILGDSISTYEDYVPEANRFFYPKGDVTSVDKTWWKQVIDKTNMILGTNESWSGSNVQSDSTGDTSACDDSRIDSLGANGNPDIILILMGINDAHREDISASGNIVSNFTLPITVDSLATLDSTTFVGGYQTMLTKIMLKYPGARIICCGLPWSKGATSAEIHEASKKIEELCDLLGCGYINIRKCGINAANLSTCFIDSVHPNSTGHALMAQYIIKQLQNMV